MESEFVAISSAREWTTISRPPGIPIPPNGTSPCRLFDSFYWSYIPETDDAVLLRGTRMGSVEKSRAHPLPVSLDKKVLSRRTAPALGIQHLGMTKKHLAQQGFSFRKADSKELRKDRRALRGCTHRKSDPRMQFEHYDATGRISPKGKTGRLAHDLGKVGLGSGYGTNAVVVHQHLQHARAHERRKRGAQVDALDAQMQQREQDAHRLLLVP